VAGLRIGRTARGLWALGALALAPASAAAGRAGLQALRSRPDARMTAAAVARANASLPVASRPVNPSGGARSAPAIRDRPGAMRTSSVPRLSDAPAARRPEGGLS
jgi:hypothetical protein